MSPSLDAAVYLTEPDDQAELLADALATDDVHVIAKAIGIVARARVMSDADRGGCVSCISGGIALR